MIEHFYLLSTHVVRVSSMLFILFSVYRQVNVALLIENFCLMYILIFCHYGMNRSRYLAEYLVEKGYKDVEFAGIKDPEHRKIQSAIDRADIIITVVNSVRDALHEQYQLDGKRMIDLHVEDRPEIVLPGTLHLLGDEWLQFQRGYVYPELKKQLDEYLPLE